MSEVEQSPRRPSFRRIFLVFLLPLLIVITIQNIMLAGMNSDYMKGCKETAEKTILLLNNTGLVNVKELHYIGQQKNPTDGYIRIKQAGSCDIKYYSGETTQMFEDVTRSMNSNGWSQVQENDLVAVFGKTVDGKEWELTYSLGTSKGSNVHQITVRPKD